MARFKQFFLLYLILFSALSWTTDAEQLLLPENFEKTLLTPHTNNLLVDVSEDISPVNVLDLLQSSRQNTALPGLTKNVVWRLYSISTGFSADTTREFWITKSNSFLNIFDVYLLDQQAVLLSQDSLGVTSQEVFLKPINLRQSSKLTLSGQNNYYLLIKQFSTSPQGMVIRLHSDENHNEFLAERQLVNSIITTILAALFVFNIVLFIGYPDRAYFWFLNFHFVLIVYFSILYGFGHSVWPDVVMQIASRHIMIMNYLLLFLLFQFSNHFLNSFLTEPWNIWLFNPKRVQITLVICMLVTSFISDSIGLWLFFTLQLLMLVIIGTRGVKYFRSGFKPAKLLIFSLVIQQIGASIGTASYLYLLPETFFTRHAFFESSIIELLIMAYAIAARTRYLESQKLRIGQRDSLTGIPNQNYIENTLNQHWSSLIDTYGKITIIGFNLSGIKEFSQNLGPSEAEKFTQRLIHYLDGNLASQDFGLCLPDTSHYVCVQSANQYFVLTDLDETRAMSLIDPLLNTGLEIVDAPLSIGLQFGSYQCNDNCETINESLRKFVVALAMAENESNRKAIYQSAMDEKFKLAGMIKRELQAAIRNRQLECWIQPQIALNTGKFKGGEILVRWRHPERGLIPPGVFIPLVEQLNMVIDVTRFILDETFNWLNENNQQNLELSVNLSSKDLLIPGFADEVDVLKHRYDIGNNHFCLEITESVLMERPEDCLSTIEQLKQLGFSISIDDFGTGFSSLSYLSQIKPDEIKIDQEFVKTINESEINLSIVKSIIQLSHNMGCICVAEGIESEQVLSTIQNIGCQVGQGYFWAKPMPIHEFSQWICENNTKAKHA